MPDHAEQLARLARGWDEAADGYESYFVPRFAPWVTAAVAAITAAPLPDGPILVPCCGTFPELPALVGKFPDREIVGIDLSPGMVRRARARATSWPQVTVLEGDASALDPHWSGRCAAVVSVFGLQQLPEPVHAIRSWAGALRPTGRLSVVYWPDSTEPDGPFALISQVVRAHIPPPDRSWEPQLVPALTAQGTTLERDDQLAFTMTHPDAPTFFDAFTNAGPLRPLATTRGKTFITQLRTDFLHHTPTTGALTHHPQARHLVAHR